MSDGDFFKGGFGGQGLYISPSKDLVIAFFGTFDEIGKDHEMTRISRQLAKSGLFDRQTALSARRGRAAFRLPDRGV